MIKETTISGLMLLLLAAGCQQRHQIDHISVPPDFALAFCVQYENDSSFVVDPLKNSAIFIVEPNGTLRAAIGPGCTLRTFPAPTRELDQKQLKELYRFCRLAELNDNSDFPGLVTTSIDPPRYQVVLNAWGKCYTHVLPIDNEDSSSILHKELLYLSGIKEYDEYRLFAR